MNTVIFRFLTVFTVGAMLIPSWAGADDTKKWFNDYAKYVQEKIAAANRSDSTDRQIAQGEFDALNDEAKKLADRAETLKGKDKDDGEIKKAEADLEKLAAEEKALRDKVTATSTRITQEENDNLPKPNESTPDPAVTSRLKREKAENEAEEAKLGPLVVKIEAQQRYIAGKKEDLKQAEKDIEKAKAAVAAFDKERLNGKDRTDAERYDIVREAADSLYNAHKEKLFKADLLLTKLDVLKANLGNDDTKLFAIHQNISEQLRDTALGEYINDQLRALAMSLCDLDKNKQNVCANSDATNSWVNKVFARKIAVPKGYNDKSKKYQDDVKAGRSIR